MRFYYARSGKTGWHGKKVVFVTLRLTLLTKHVYQRLYKIWFFTVRFGDQAQYVVILRVSLDACMRFQGDFFGSVGVGRFNQRRSTFDQ